MRAIIDASMSFTTHELLGSRIPSTLALLLDRPFLQHVIEVCVNGGIEKFDILLSSHPEKIEAALGDGRRWGVEISYHLLKDPSQFVRIFETLKADRFFLFARGDRLPALNINPLTALDPQPELSAICTQSNPSEPSWSGWAILPAHLSPALSLDLGYDGFFTWLRENNAHIIPTPEVIACDSCAALLKANEAALSHETFNFLMRTATEVEQGLWISRDVALHPDAKLIAPVYLDEQIRIEDGVTLGPHVIMGKGTMVAKDSTLENAVVFPNTYVGEGLEIASSVLDRNCLVNTEFDSETFISEQFILGDMEEKNIKKWLAAQVSRLTAMGLIFIFFPLIAVTVPVLKLFRKGELFHKIRAIRLPTAADPFAWNSVELSFFQWPRNNPHPGMAFWWKDFLLRFLPGLFNVIKGKMAITGVSPRTREELEALDRDWREIYIQGQLGLISEAMINFGADPNPDELYSAEAIYISSPSVIRDIKLVLKYFTRLFLPPKSVQER
ncbi:NDP-sugar pyrophosphorylase, includes eIF-2Bgamma, eIF-2Bepsilon, and LPS biosynthesis proteins [Desulfocicer vacuolatum DSM 3385]|uniref:NDP-sugar pyrophosphorylase, includes eIF-2Bgamma, eIF-2Bepsilon, and LPS biosynthesis proteins n=1 Tax=Desulfocicer vacuolatum DSM 3385 TaxID=1121400 RepID=A0A1W2DNH9_9BACT|nr:sugar transferase [Desulfocicer vacuolatum]SMC99065.1 NDP-sugar pyrophosphorylase, includes eIF-2Bgamma, eIF-2Bepsilon, and LPS biosynthesis proteins [Desulfocicer vacuolatum DSM 3385]